MLAFSAWGEFSPEGLYSRDLFDMEHEEHSLVSADTASYFNDFYFLIGLACLPDNIS